ncbi:uncharacterized protein V2V93DRAFT_383189 [Kockiozyma suomiensis]|uniref:uncharacterized protein n=1 Tax=Kockiozyma suomiensis TaxID=1337062 RepID=UPI0033435389
MTEQPEIAETETVAPSRTRKKRETGKLDAETFFMRNSANDARHLIARQLREKQAEEQKKKKKRKNKKMKKEGEEEEEEKGKKEESVVESIQSDDSDVVLLHESRPPSPKKRQLPRLSPPPTLSKEELMTARRAIRGDDTPPRARAEWDYDEDENNMQHGAMTGAVDEDFTDLLPELAARVRARTREDTPGFNVTVSVDTTQGMIDAFENNREVENEERKVGTKVFTMRATQALRKTRRAWCRMCGGIPEARVVLLDRATFARVYDSTSPVDLGVSETEPLLGLIAVLDEEVEGLQEQNRQRILERDKDDDDETDKVQMQGQVQSGGEQEEEEEEEGTAIGLKIFLQDGQGEKITVRVKPESTVAAIVEYYKSRRPMSANKVIVLSLDDDDLEPEQRVHETELEDEVTVDVKLR